jgi:HK97 family phage portal protein
VRITTLFGDQRHQLVTGEYDNWGSVTNPSVGLLNHLGGPSTVAGVHITEWVAEGMPAVYACVHAISETVGQIPLKLYKKTAQGREVAEDHPLYLVLHDLANPEMTAVQFRELMTRNLAMWGRSYAFIQRDRAGDVVALWPMHPTRMIVDRDSLNRKVFKYYTGKNEQGGAVYQEFVHNPERPDILHLHINSCDGLDGRSPILINRESLGITKAAEDYVAAWFGNGAIPGMVLTHPGRLSPKAKENVRDSWLKKFMGGKNANRVAILEEDIKLQVVGVDPEKSQLDKLRLAQVEAAARIYRVPLFVIQNQTKDTSWGSGIDSQFMGWINTGLMPYFEQWQQVISRDLLSRKTYRTHYAKFVTAALTRGDLKTRFDTYATARQNGIYSANEIREMEEANRIDEGDVYLMPSGALPVIGDGTPIEMAPEPKPAKSKALRMTLASEPDEVM